MVPAEEHPLKAGKLEEEKYETNCDLPSFPPTVVAGMERKVLYLRSMSSLLNRPSRMSCAVAVEAVVVIQAISSFGN
jgi:hypothetical protein